MKQKGLVPTADAVGDLTHYRSREPAVLLVSIPLAFAFGIREAAELLAEDRVLDGVDYLPDLSCGITIETADQLPLADVVAAALMVDNPSSGEFIDVCVVGQDMIAWPGSCAFDRVYSDEMKDQRTHWQTLNKLPKGRRYKATSRQRQAGTSHRSHR